ncbi:hypothetical protein KYK29_14125 [Shinella daejeonensis]|uniref:hypothetical protein n=1 Tax=Shinella daejeonensis TaxID=659017 RepID=UPI0020C818D9|nr:hypothetical protein [Shinella daejeonensis]MCP8896064.1 hypothetical protein [Shinella daejeonensis]
MKKARQAARFASAIYRIFLVAAMSVLLPPIHAPAEAQEEGGPRWFGGSFDGGTTVLAYGMPDSDYIMLSFSCEPGASLVKIGIQDEESSAEDGDLLRVRLAAGGLGIEFSDKAAFNHDSGGVELHADLPLDGTLRRILSGEGPLEIVVDGHMQHYDMKGAAAPARAMIAACDSPGPSSDLDVTVTNRATRPLQSLSYSQAGVNAFDSDEFGYEPLATGASRTFTIPGGRNICTFDIAVIFTEEDDAECCSMGEPAGTQNLCENSEFIVHG